MCWYPDSSKVLFRGLGVVGRLDRRATGTASRSRPTGYLTFVRKTSVYLSEADAERLAHLAAREGRPQAAISRDAIARYEPPSIGDRNFAMIGAGEGDGRSVADIPDEELYEGFGE